MLIKSHPLVWNRLCRGKSLVHTNCRKSAPAAVDLVNLFVKPKQLILSRHVVVPITGVSFVWKELS